MATISAAGASENVRVLAAAFAENGAGTYDADFQMPPGATVVDIQIDAVALWAAGTSASMEIGDDADPDGFFTAVDLKATDLLAGEGITFARGGGQEGAYHQVAATHSPNKMYSATGRTIRARVVSVGAGTTGRTNVRVLYTLAAPVTVTQ